MMCVPVEGFPEYVVNFEGLIFKVSMEGDTEVFTAVSTFTNHGGYLTVALRKNKRSHTKRVHLLVWASFVGKIPNGYQVNHKFGVKSHNGLMDLDLMTQKQNLAHSLEHGLRKKGKIESKLDDCQVLAMYTVKNHKGIKRSDLVAYSGTTIRNVEMILAGHSRKNFFKRIMCDQSETSIP